jgi:hypothetical protein
MTHYTAQTPTDVQDYEITYACDLGTDIIISSAWAITQGDGALVINEPAATFTSTTTTVWISGGTLGQDYLITNTITTAGGRTIQDSIGMSIVPVSAPGTSGCCPVGCASNS